MYELLSGDVLPPRAELTPTHVRSYLTEVAAEQARRSLRLFVKRGWPVLQPSSPTWNWHIDAMCLPGETLIETESGPLPIGHLVESGWDGKVLSYCHLSGRIELKPVKLRMRSPPQGLLKIHLRGHGVLEITGNHPVYVEGRGYVSADLLRPGDVVLRLCQLRTAVQATKKPTRQVLQPAVFRVVEGQDRGRDMPGLRGTQILGRFDVPGMLWKTQAARVDLPLSPMRKATLPHPRAVVIERPYLRGILQSRVSGQVCNGPEESGLCTWFESGSIPQILSLDQAVRHCSGEGPLLLVPGAGSFGYSPHQPQQGGYQILEPGGAVPSLPCQATRKDASRDVEIGRAVISSIDRSLRVPEAALYNLEVEDNQNYFANGILVHNCDHLAYVTMGEIRFLMISTPPRSTKTMVCTVDWPAWHWLHIPGEQFLTAGVDDQLARDAAILSRRLIESPWYQTQYPGEIILFDDENTAGMYRNRKGGYRMIGSLQGRITGVGGSVQILDDPHDAKKIESDTVRHNALAWHDNAWRSRVNNPDQAKKVYVGQRTHDMDIFGHVLEGEGSRWCHLILPMEYDPTRRCVTFFNKGDGVEAGAEPIFKDPRTKENEILDPKRMSAKTVNAEKRLVSEAAWQAQYNQRPTGQGGLILKRHWWRPWVQPEWRTNAGAERPMPRFDQILQIWDTALEEDEMKDNDFSACTTWGIFQFTEQYLDKNLLRPADFPEGKAVSGETRTCMMLLDAVQERYAYPDLRQKAIDLNKEFAPDVILIEKKVSGHSLVQELRRKRLPVKAVLLSGSSGKSGKEGDLVARANSASLMLEKGTVFYPPRPFSYAVMEECSKFPNGDHDDYVSTCVIAWMYARRYYDLQLPDDEKDDVSPWAWKKRPTKRYA